MLTGDKVTLRPLDKRDYPSLYRFRNDLLITILADDEPPMPRTYEAFTSHMDELEKKDEGVMFVIEADGKPIGSVALFHFDKTSGTCELGIAIGEHDYLGKGYGTETVRLSVEYAFRYRNLHKVYLHVTADNERAIASYKKCGFVEEGRLRQHMWSDGTYKDVIPMGILRTDVAG